MVQLKRAANPVEIRTVTQQGECTVNIKLEIVVSMDSAGLQVGIRQEDKPEADEQRWAIPEFGDMPKVQFGKKV